MEIHWSHFDQLDDVDREVVERKLQELAREYPDLIDVQIVVSSPPSSHAVTREVRLTSLARGRQIVAAHEGEDVLLSLKYLVEAIDRELAIQARRDG